VTADGGAYDLWVLGPNGFHRHFTGDVSPEQRRVGEPEIRVEYDQRSDGLRLVLSNRGDVPTTFRLSANAYYQHWEPVTFRVSARGDHDFFIPLKRTAYWYDFTVRVVELEAFSRRFAGRLETGRHALSDPAIGGRARGDRG
jgi:phospholipase C